MTKWTRELIVEAAKKAAAKRDGPLSRPEFSRRSGISNRQIYRLFPQGGWTEVCQLAGIGRHPMHKKTFSDEQLLQEYHRVVSKLRAIPSWYRFDSLATVSPDTLRKRLGLKRNLLQRYRQWLKKNHPKSPLLQLLPIPSQHESVGSASLPSGGLVTPPRTKEAGVVFGAPIHFHGLQHAPTNEQGVVCLFGMLSSELGLIVEAIQSTYPDCQAKRCVDRKQNRWQRLRIEFEFVSSNFRSHGHDPACCDAIVCWEHDWPECALEVIELRSVINQLEE